QVCRAVADPPGGGVMTGGTGDADTSLVRPRVAGESDRAAAAARAVPVDRSAPAAGFDTIDEAIAEIAAGLCVVVVDDEDRENEGELIFAAEKATPELVAFMVKYTSGYVCAPLPEEGADRLELPPKYRVNQDPRGTA